jgi:hypothetical protein
MILFILIINELIDFFSEENDIMDKYYESYVELNLLNDMVFKYFFGHEMMKDNAEYLVNTVLEFNNASLKGSLHVVENKPITLPIFAGKTLKFDVVGVNDYEVIDIEVKNRKKATTYGE